jgi:hypothetical protein
VKISLEFDAPDDLLITAVEGHDLDPPMLILKGMRVLMTVASEIPIPRAEWIEVEGYLLRSVSKNGRLEPLS